MGVWSGVVDAVLPLPLPAAATRVVLCAPACSSMGRQHKRVVSGGCSGASKKAAHRQPSARREAA